MQKKESIQFNELLCRRSQITARAPKKSPALCSSHITSAKQPRLVGKQLKGHGLLDADVSEVNNHLETWRYATNVKSEFFPATTREECQCAKHSPLC